MFTVTNVTDSGAGSLRQAIADAEGAAGTDTIQFGPSLDGEAIILHSALVITTSGIRINGDFDGDGVPDMSGGVSFGDNHHFDVDAGGYLHLSNISLMGGVEPPLLSGNGVRPDRASSIDNAGTVFLDNVTISGSNAYATGLFSTGDAATIINRAGATLNAQDVLFYDNTAIANRGHLNGQDGGHASAGIFNQGGTLIPSTGSTSPTQQRPVVTVLTICQLDKVGMAAIQTRSS